MGCVCVSGVVVIVCEVGVCGWVGGEIWSCEITTLLLAGADLENGKIYFGVGVGGGRYVKFM